MATARCDIFIAALGYESRANAVAGRLPIESAIKLCFGFDHNAVLAFDKNLVWFQEKQFELHSHLTADAFADFFAVRIREAILRIDHQDDVVIAVDISCFDRYRLACVVDLLAALGRSRRIVCDFWYSIAAFAAPKPAAGRNEIAGPVHRKYAGRFLEPGLPLALIAGLGYEVGKVVGVTEYLQASRVVALFPESPVLEYEPEVTRANSTLLDDLKAREIIHYQVNDPRKTIATLDAAIRGLQGSHNIVLFPGGPKIFVLACLIAHSENPRTAVWRVSSGSAIKPRDAIPSEHFVGARWSPSALPQQN